MEFKYLQTNLKCARPMDPAKWKSMKKDLVRTGLSPHEFNLLYYILDDFGPVLAAWKKYADSDLCKTMLKLIMARKGFLLSRVKSVGESNHRQLLGCFYCLSMDVPIEFSAIMSYIEETEDGYKVK